MIACAHAHLRDDVEVGLGDVYGRLQVQLPQLGAQLPVAQRPRPVLVHLLPPGSPHAAATLRRSAAASDLLCRATDALCRAIAVCRATADCPAARLLTAITDCSHGLLRSQSPAERRRGEAVRAGGNESATRCSGRNTDAILLHCATTYGGAGAPSSAAKPPCSLARTRPHRRSGMIWSPLINLDSSAPLDPHITRQVLPCCADPAPYRPVSTVAAATRRSPGHRKPLMLWCVLKAMRFLNAATRSMRPHGIE